MQRDAQKELAEDKVHLMCLFESGIKRLKSVGEEYAQFSDALEELKVIEFSAEIKKIYSKKVRILYAHMAAQLSAPNWQSPSFWHTRASQAGREEGTISASSGDYKRDMYKAEKEYSQNFIKEYVDHSMRLAPFAYATSSGMSAVTTVLVHLQNKVGPEDVVLAGKSSYFQNKWQLQKLFGGRVRYVDEFDTEEIIRLTKELQPPIVFLDSICGAESLPIPNLRALIPALSKVLSNRSTLVLDNTGLGSMYQPLRDLPWSPLGMHVVVVESLLKFHQFGMDRVGGGIIWKPSISESGLFETRMHLGTIMPEASVCAMPTPNRALLDARLVRIGSNAVWLAKKLDASVQTGNTILESVIHPSLPHYAGYSWTKDLPFQGAFITLRFKAGKQTVSQYDAFVSRVERAGKEAGVDIIGGTSFGFDTTRLYVTARYATDITAPFVRISVGTETIDEIEALAAVFEKALL